MQTIISKSEWLNADNIISYVSSFETNLNLKKNISSDNPHYFIVGDFNFDTLVDFVVVNNIPPCSGTPTYNFYFQKSDSTFYFNKPFSEQVLFLPQSINPKNRTFDVNSHSGCCFFDFKTFKILENGKIKLIHHKIIENGKVSIII